MFKLKDRWGRDMVLGMTHEEVIAWLAAREIRSYRDLPQIWYQIQTKERDEARPRSGVLRTREFVMKDSYTLDPDAAALDRSYAAHERAYRTIFERCGLRFHVAHSDTGMMGGLGAHEFMAPCAAGEDEIALCAACGYAANVEIARGVPAAPDFPAGGREEVATPNVRTIAEVSALAEDRPAADDQVAALSPRPSGLVLALVRGDHALHERKLTRALGAGVPRRPSRGGRCSSSGAPVGSVGPVGARVPIVADEALREGAYVVGANREGVHLRGVAPGRDFEARFADLHTVAAGEACPQCGAAAGGRAASSRSATSSSSAPSTRRRSAPCTWTSRARSSRSSWAATASARPASPPPPSSRTPTPTASCGRRPSRPSTSTSSW